MIIKEIKDIMEKINNMGFECYLTGGYVRDFVLNKTQKNINLITNMGSFESLEIEGTLSDDEFTLSFMINQIPATLTRYNKLLKDGKKVDALSLLTHLNNCDFSINTLVMDINEKITDTHNSMISLQSGYLNTLYNDTLVKDKSRILRAVRLSAQYGLKISKTTIDMIKEDNDISGVNKNIIRDEFSKILLCYKPSKWLKLLASLGLLEQIIPDMKKTFGFKQHRPNHDKTVFQHIIYACDNVEPKLGLRLAALFHDIGKPNVFRFDENGMGKFEGHHAESARLTKKIMNDLGYDKEITKYTCILVFHHMSRYDFLRPKLTKDFIKVVGKDRLNDLFNLQISDVISAKPPFRLDKLMELKQECNRIIKKETKKNA